MRYDEPEALPSLITRLYPNHADGIQWWLPILEDPLNILTFVRAAGIASLLAGAPAFADPPQPASAYVAPNMVHAPYGTLKIVTPLTTSPARIAR